MSSVIVPNFDWIVWDTKLNQRASIASFLSEKSANAQIEAWRDRQSRGGRPDVDTTHLVARLERNSCL